MEGSPQQQPWWEKKMDEKSVSLPVLTKHFELHNRTEGKSQKTVDGIIIPCNGLPGF